MHKTLSPTDFLVQNFLRHHWILLSNKKCVRRENRCQKSLKSAHVVYGWPQTPYDWRQCIFFQDVVAVKEAYEDVWTGLETSEQEEIINESIIRPEAIIRELSTLRQNVTLNWNDQKIVHRRKLCLRDFFSKILGRINQIKGLQFFKQLKIEYSNSF